MTLEEAKREAEEMGARMVFRRSKSWYHRGILTQFDEPEDKEADDWEVCLHHGFYPTRKKAA